MIKIIAPESQDFSEPVAALIKTARSGLRGVDLHAFEKRAGALTAHQVAKLAEQTKEDEPLIHLLAIGATEDYSANRNGDGFTRATCRQYHDTFTKRAKFYRDHKNKDPKKCYGHVKMSIWNEPMKRVELVVMLNGSKEAAKRNGGLFADKELEKLAAGKPLGVSMACFVKYDCCSYCNNKAASRAQYCDSEENGGHCKAGGLKHNIGSLIEIDDGIHHLHADNPDPTFFDISHVFRPADRIAYVTGMLKAAAGRTVSGAELAEMLGVSGPYDLLINATQSGDTQRMLKHAWQLADLEQTMRDGTFPYVAWINAFSPEVHNVTDNFPAFSREKIGQFLRALADERITLPLTDFVMLVANQDREKAAATATVVQSALPGIYSHLLARGDLPELLAGTPFVSAPAASPEFRLWANKQASALSLRETHIRRRVTQAALRQVDDIGHADNRTALLKAAGSRDYEPALKLAEAYAVYKLAFLGSISESDNEMQLTTSMALLQNYA